MFRGYKEKLSRLDDATLPEGPASKKDPISAHELAQAYSAFRDFIPQMDYDAVEMVLSELKEYDLPEKDKKIFHELENNLKNFNWSAMEEIIKKRHLES